MTKEPRVWLEVPDEPNDPDGYAITKIPLGDITRSKAHKIRDEIESILIKHGVRPDYGEREYELQDLWQKEFY